MDNSTTSGKKGKKKAKNTKTLSLNDFLGDISAPGTIKPMNWADEADEEFQSVNSSLTYQSSATAKVITLPTAPRAARSIEIDQSRIPDAPPFTAYVGNLPYETNPETIGTFFQGLPIVNVRLPEENGRFKGFGYIEFADRVSLVKALEMNEETFQRRTIRIDIADNQNKDGGGNWRSAGDRDRNDRYGGGPDPTEGDWRKASRENSNQTNSRSGFDSSSREYGSSRDYGSQGGSWRKSSQEYRRPSDSRYDSGRDRYGGDHGYNRQRSDEQPRERPQLKLQPRQKPLEDQNAPESRSSIFGSAKPVDTAAKEREMEEKIKQLEKLPTEPIVEKRSSNIFGSAKPVDTSAKEREIEEKIAAQEKMLLEKVQMEQQKPPARQKSVSIFGDAKPVDTTAREKEIEEKIRKQEEQAIREFAGDASQGRPRRTSERSDEYHYKSPRRSRTSSTRSTDENETSSPHHITSTRKSSGSSISGDPPARKAEYKPAPIPKESAWTRPKINSNAVTAPPSSNAWSRDESQQQRGEREEAEGNSKEDEEDERRPEGAADDDQSLKSRDDIGDGSEAKERPPPRPHYSAVGRSSAPISDMTRRPNMRRDDRPGGNYYQNRGGTAGRGGPRGNDDNHGNMRRGDGDSESHRGEKYQGANRSRRDWRGSKSDAERKRDSSGDSRPECDRPDAAGQEQPASKRNPKHRGKIPPSAVVDEKPINFVTTSKFALLALDDSDDDATE